jgi:hypothetical protein
MSFYELIGNQSIKKFNIFETKKLTKIKYTQSLSYPDFKHTLDDIIQYNKNSARHLLQHSLKSDGHRITYNACSNVPLETLSYVHPWMLSKVEKKNTKNFSKARFPSFFCYFVKENNIADNISVRCLEQEGGRICLVFQHFRPFCPQTNILSSNIKGLTHEFFTS